ncbi:hypothetical protein B0A50_01701 [Salinomyces thailandicus]|uniref:2,5-diamino-6-ribosylamino-4(3H)-pyrimidinone 5'-phosphate reductase n=1 Tax=Salinomyces thailandicus TaxID=706561 RepID=A0A4U0U940_9PEZI|nr:hypothetical protein B0A50_01701 [Salinomyces thailandica]
MSEISELTSADKEFLQQYLPPPRPEDTLKERRRGLPFVTLTYASSLDGMISLAPGLRTNLSGPETKSMTHYLRLHHEAILVGVGTAIPDDPGLNSRYPGATLEKQPQPVIIDPNRRWNVGDSKVLKLAQQEQGHTPWIITAKTARISPPTTEEVNGQNFELRPLIGRTRVAASGDGETMPVEWLDWVDILKHIKRMGINSVMIEGGATIISTLLSLPHLVHSVIVTVAPTWLGEGGVAVSPAQKREEGERVNAARLEETAWRQFGADAVLCGRLLQE